MQIELYENRQRLLYAINRKLANKIYDILNPYFDDYDCVCFSENISCNHPKLLEYAIRKFRHSDCGITRYNGMILVIDTAGRGEMREIFSRFLEMAVPENYMFKGNDAEKFFQPFENPIKSNIMHNCIKYDDVLRLIMADPHTAARYALADQMGRGGNMWMRHLIYEHAKRFDECYAEHEQMKK